MISLFFTILLLSTAICSDLPFNTPSIFVLKIDTFPPNLLKWILLILVLLLLYLTYVEMIKKGILNTTKINFKIAIRNFLEKKNGQIIDNLLDLYPNRIKTRKDIYYINKALILKTGDVYIESKFIPPGIILKIGNLKLTWLIITRTLKTILEKEILLYMVLFLWSILMIGIFLFQLVF